MALTLTHSSTNTEILVDNIIVTHRINSLLTGLFIVFCDLYDCLAVQKETASAIPDSVFYHCRTNILNINLLKQNNRHTSTFVEISWCFWI